jgi:hypothetical protein
VPAQTFNAFGVARLFTGIPSMVTGARVHPRVDKNLILNHVAAYDFVSAATVPFTFLDVVRTTYAGITFGQSQQHIGCRIVWVAPWWRFYHLLLWHSIAQLWNDVEVTASEGLPEAQISRCPQYEPRWFDYFYN